MTGMFSVTWVLALGILFIAVGIGLIFNHDNWYLFPIPIGIGVFIIYCDFVMKRGIIKYYEEQSKPLHELKEKILKELDEQNTKEKERQP